LDRPETPFTRRFVVYFRTALYTLSGHQDGPSDRTINMSTKRHFAQETFHFASQPACHFAELNFTNRHMLSRMISP
jgi:hypothetical protein